MDFSKFQVPINKLFMSMELCFYKCLSIFWEMDRKNIPTNVFILIFVQHIIDKVYGILPILCLRIEYLGAFSIACWDQMTDYFSDIFLLAGI